MFRRYSYLTLGLIGFCLAWAVGWFALHFIPNPSYNLRGILFEENEIFLAVLFPLTPASWLAGLWVIIFTVRWLITGRRTLDP